MTDQPDGHAFCKDCKAWKPLADFNRDSKRPNGRFIYCRVCQAARWQRNSDRVGLQRTAKRHNLSLDRLIDLLAGGCGVCQSVEQLDVDHDHGCCPGSESCGMCVRGALCRLHNMALGHLGDNLDGVMRLVRYLEGSV